MTKALTEASRLRRVGKVKFNNDYGNIPCEVAARAYGIDLYHWLRWNPSVLNGSDRYVPDNCTLENNTQYCAIAWDPLKVQPAEPDKYEPAPTGATANATKECEYWYVVSEGETCEEIIEEHDIPLWALFEWNPSIGPKCESMQANAAYCVQGPGWRTICYAATQTPTASPSSTAPKDVSTAVATTKESTGSNSKDTAKTTVKNTATKTAPGPPAPTQSRIVENCQEWYVAVKGDGCQAIADKFKITLKQFYEWNPAVGSKLSFLYLGAIADSSVPAYWSTLRRQPTNPSPSSRLQKPLGQGGVLRLYWEELRARFEQVASARDYRQMVGGFVFLAQNAH